MSRIRMRRAVVPCVQATIAFASSKMAMWKTAVGFVDAVTKPLWEAFDNLRVEPHIIEDFTRKVLTRSW